MGACDFSSAKVGNRIHECKEMEYTLLPRNPRKYTEKTNYYSKHTPPLLHDVLKISSSPHDSSGNDGTKKHHGALHKF